MAEIHINPENIQLIIKDYEARNQDFVLRNFAGDTKKKICTFYVAGMECRVNFFIKKNTVKVMPVGNNIEAAKPFITFIKSKGFSASEMTKTVTIKCSKEILDSLIAYIGESFEGVIAYEKSTDNIYKFIGFNRDYLTFTFYPATKSAMLQGRPFFVFNVIATFFSELDAFSFEEIIKFSNDMTGDTTSHSATRDLITSKLSESSAYLGEALLKSISGALSQQNQTLALEDYTGCLTGIFKALEGYLKKVLTTKFGYTLQKNASFSMFKQDSGKHEIESNSAISQKAKEHLIVLYKLYKHKRNVYLHATVDPTFTPIIENKKEAIEISDEILTAIEKSYKIFYGGEYE